MLLDSVVAESGSYKTPTEPKALERAAIAGDSPVGERFGAFLAALPSTTGHEKPCGNSGGPSPKAKYYSATDSEPVPSGKGEKHPC